MRLVPITHLKENSCIALNVIDNEGRFMLKSGQKITSSGIKILNNLGISYVYINDEYCFNNEIKRRTSELDAIFTHIQTLHQIGTKIIEGTSGLEDVILAKEVASQLVDEVLTIPSDFKISYEPTKLAKNSIIEQNIYVAMMATALGVKMNLEKKDLVNLCLASLLKDVALLSPKISAENGSLYKTHPTVAYTYLKQTYKLDDSILNAVLQHHEFCDGTGFPNKLSGDQISVFAKIIGLVDCFYEVKSTHAHLDSTELLFETHLKKILRKFDAEMITCFIRNAEVFSLDTLIRLNNDDLAVIYQNNPNNPFKPVIKIVKSNTYEFGEVINLQESPLVIKNIQYYVED